MRAVYLVDDVDEAAERLDNAIAACANFCAKQVKRAGRGFTRFDHYHLRVLLYAGGVTWPTQIRPPRITSTRPHSSRKSPQSTATTTQRRPNS